MLIGAWLLWSLLGAVAVARVSRMASPPVELLNARAALVVAWLFSVAFLVSGGGYG